MSNSGSIIKDVSYVNDAGARVVISDHVRVATTFIQRLLGLIATGGLKDGEGLLLQPCNGIHTFGLREPIDVVVLDRNGIVLRVVGEMHRNRIMLPMKHGVITIELKAGLATKSGVLTGYTVLIRD
ncbi:MAG: DUF192 domain-containing protein [Chthonomonadales bacterium]